MKEKILLFFHTHFDYPGIGPDDPAGRRTSEAIKITTEILERYNVKAQYGVTGSLYKT